MRCLYFESGKWEVLAGCSIRPTLEEAKALAAEHGEVTFSFNDVQISVRSDSPVELIERDFMRQMAGYITGPIGAYPKAELCDEEKANDARIQKLNEEEQAKARAEYNKRQKEKQDAAEAKIGSLSIELKEGMDSEYRSYKEKNSDPYGGAVVSYADRWARLMQAEMAAGKKIAEMAESTSHEADVEGITGFMYGCAVQSLARFWKHGEALRLWHNKTSQLGTEGDKANETGGVLNPACLTIGG